MGSCRIIKIDPEKIKEGLLKEAAEVIRKGGLVIIPTETVYGIAANMLDEKAVSRLYEIKKRPKDKFFSVLIAEKKKIEEFCQDVPVSAYKLMDKYWPGPLTLILKSKDSGTIGIRMPDHPVALKLIEYARVPIACPSANLSGEPAPKNLKEITGELKSAVDLAIDAGQTGVGVESSIVDLTVEPPVIIREAAIKKEEISRIIKRKVILFICTGNSCRSVMAKALMEKKMKEAKRDDLEVISAGIMMLGGLGASESTKEVLLAEGIDVSGHRSQRATKEMIKKSDLILVMEKIHEDAILELAPEVKNRLFLLKEFAKIEDNHLDIADPIGRPLDFYQKTFAVIKEAIERIIKII